MARINLEDSLFKDTRYIELVLLIGNRHAALGAVVEAFILAQEFYLNLESDRLIPLNEWKRRKAEDKLIEVGLAELKIYADLDLQEQQGVYVVGSDEQFGWLIQRQNAGKKGGRPKTEESDRLPDDNGSNPLTLSLTPSLSLNNNLNNNIIAPTSKNEVSALSKQTEKTLIKINQPKELADLLENKNKQILFELYGDADFIKREFYKIQNWLDRNPKKNNKTKRGWLGFVSTWLDNAWPKYQQTIPTNKAKASSAEELMSMMGWS